MSSQDDADRVMMRDYVNMWGPRVPRQVGTWKVWDQPDHIFVVYHVLLVMSFEQHVETGHIRPCDITETHDEIAAVGKLERWRVDRGIEYLLGAGYLKPGAAPGSYAIAHHEMFNPQAPYIAPFDPATRRD